MTPEEILATQAIISRAIAIRKAEASMVPERQLTEWHKENDNIEKFIEKAMEECVRSFGLMQKYL